MSFKIKTILITCLKYVGLILLGLIVGLFLTEMVLRLLPQQWGI